MRAEGLLHVYPCSPCPAVSALQDTAQILLSRGAVKWGKLGWFLGPLSVKALKYLEYNLTGLLWGANSVHFHGAQIL